MSKQIMSLNEYLDSEAPSKKDIAKQSDDLFRSYLRLKDTREKIVQEISSRQLSKSNQFDTIYLKIQKDLLTLYDMEITCHLEIINSLEKISKDVQNTSENKSEERN